MCQQVNSALGKSFLRLKVLAIANLLGNLVWELKQSSELLGKFEKKLPSRVAEAKLPYSL